MTSGDDAFPALPGEEVVDPGNAERVLDEYVEDLLAVKRRPVAGKDHVGA